MYFLKNLKTKILKRKSIITIIGLGYVGLPVAYYFSKKYKVYGFDIDKKRLSQLANHYDRNNSISREELSKETILFEDKVNQLKETDIFIITTPTPIDNKNKPNLYYVINALKVIIKAGIKDKLIILESTVFPGASYDTCIKFIEKHTHYILNKDFSFGYSPERINPGDKKNNFENIAKVVSGSTTETANIIYRLYKTVVKKVYKASSIKLAETAKLIENTQRDLNIAFINEIAIACNKMNLSFSEVHKLASTKWNFINFNPGLVGGHCIGVDPYYLFYSLKKKKYNPKLLLSGRSLNERFPIFLCNLFLNNIKIKNPRILLMGATYKANCNDVRNSKSLTLYEQFKKKKCKIFMYDPYVEKADIKKLKGINFVNKPKKNYYDGIFLSVDHLEFKKIGYKTINSFGNKNCKIFDLKNMLKKRINIIHL